MVEVSGSPAEPKASPLTSKNLLASFEYITHSLELTPELVMLNIMPPFHIGALIDLTLSSVKVRGARICTRDMTAQPFHKRL
jgi:oxalate---CoA ligase